MRRLVMTALVVTLCIAMLGPAPARAANTVVTAAAFVFNPPVVVIEEGDTLTLRNSEPIAIPHNLVEIPQTAPGGKPRFASAIINPGKTASVVGVGALARGAYAFYCSIHPFMVGTLVVTPDGY